MAVPTVGWAVAAVLMVIGALLLLFRRGRGLLIFGALISIATTAWAQFGLGYGGEDAAIPVSSGRCTGAASPWSCWPCCRRPGAGSGAARGTPKPSTVIGTTESGAILWPGM